MAALLLGVIAAFCAIVVAAIPPSPEVPAAYAASSPLARLALLTAAIALLIAVVATSAQSRTRRLGVLAAIAAIAWLGPELEGWTGGPAVIRSLAVATAPLLVVVLVVFVGAPRAIVAAVIAAAAAAALVWLLLRDPFFDVYCWRSCGSNALLVHSEPDVVRTVGRIWSAAVLASGVLVVIIAARRLTTATTAARRTLLPILVAVAAAGATEAAHAGVLLRTPLEDPQLGGFAGTHIARAIALTAVAGALIWAAFDLRRTRSRVARLAVELGEAPAPGTLRDRLAAALRDQSVQVLYWLPDSRRYVDAAGMVRQVPAGGATTQITRHGRLLAVVVHDPSPMEGADLEREIGSAARLAVENEALRAEVLVQLAELRASRARIVETGDAARRRLERDLHDGAQQRLLAVALELRLARAGADGERAEVLDAALAEIDAAFVELRELAHGIFPAVLTEAGLEAALVTLTADAPIPVELQQITDERFAPSVETGAYVIAAEAIRDAQARSASHVVIRAMHESGSLVVDTHHDGDGAGSSLVHVADRIGALGGALDVGPGRLRAEIPCG